MTDIQKTALEKHVQTIFLGITSAAIIGCFKFLWSLNITVAKMQERDISRTSQIEAVQTSVNELRLDVKTTKHDVQDVKERVIKLERE